MKATLLQAIVCDRCGGELRLGDSELACHSCERCIVMQAHAPLFTQPPPGLQPSDKLERGPDVGTPWRQANWRFLHKAVASLDPRALILDVGAGRGDFAAALQGRDYLALDVYPYPEIDIVCDLTQTNPLRPASLDAILLLNVLEHVYDTHALLAALAGALKPGGRLVVAIPFMVKMHQTPIDYVRYTHYALQRLGEAHGLSVETLEGFYDPLSVLGEGTGNLKHAVLPGVRGVRHYAGRALLAGIQAFSSGLRQVIGPGKTLDPGAARSQAPTGYQLIYKKS